MQTGPRAVFALALAGNGVVVDLALETLDVATGVGKIFHDGFFTESRNPLSARSRSRMCSRSTA